MDNLRAVGATVDPAGTRSADFLAPEKQLLTVNGEDIQAYEFGSAEEADAGAEGVSASGSSIVTTFADGTGKSSVITWVEPPHFYKAGKLIVLYVGCDSDVIDALRETMGPQFAGGAGVSQCPDQVPPTTPIVAHGGPVKDYVSLVDNLRAAGATVDPAGTASGSPFAPETQLLTVNGEDINAYEFGSVEEADAAAEGVSASGSPIVTTFADGTGKSSMVTWVESPHFYKAGKLIVLYVGCDSDVIDVLQETMGPQFAGGAGVGVHGVSVAGHGRCPEGVQPVPAISSGILRLTFDGVEYGPIVLGIPINMDDMEVVGTGTRNNSDGDASVSVEVYRPKAGATTDVYIFHPATTVEDREPGGPPPAPARPATWTRWTDDITPPAPAALPAPLQLTFEGVEYTGVQILGALSPTGVCVDETQLPPAVSSETRITPCMTPINMDDMEVVGTGTDHNPDGDASVEVY